MVASRPGKSQNTKTRRRQICSDLDDRSIVGQICGRERGFLLLLS